MSGLIGRKVGMTQVYDGKGRIVPVTVIQAGPCPVLQVKKPASDGYASVQVGYETAKVSRVTKPMQGHFRRAGVSPCRTVGEFRVSNPDAYQLGQKLTVGLFKQGDLLRVTGTSKGRGFAGTTKRHKFKGGDESHGCDTKRGPGSIGSSSTPSKVWKGKRLPGHFGAATVTVRNLTVAGVDATRDLIFVKGAVPGSTGGLVSLSLATGEAQPGAPAAAGTTKEAEA